MESVLKYTGHNVLRRQVHRCCLASSQHMILACGNLSHQDDQIDGKRLWSRKPESGMLSVSSKFSIFKWMSEPLSGGEPETYLLCTAVKGVLRRKMIDSNWERFVGPVQGLPVARLGKEKLGK